MKTGPTYAACFILSVLLLLNCSINAQMLVSNIEVNETLTERTETTNSSHLEKAPSFESIHWKLLQELQGNVSYPKLAIENCIEKKVVIRLSFLNATSTPTFEIYRDDLEIFREEIQAAIEEIDFSRILPDQISKPADFYLPIVFSLR